MINYLSLLFSAFLLIGCGHNDNIDVRNITLNIGSDFNITLDRYISFSQEFFENKNYPVNRYCKDKEALLTDDKFSTEIYLKVTNSRTKESVTSKYPIWFLVNDDTSNIKCVRRSSNFIPKEPLVVSSRDRLILEILQENREEKSVPIRELSILLNMASFVVPYSNLLLNGTNIVNNYENGYYLNSSNNSLNRDGLAGIRTKEFDMSANSIKFDLAIPNGEDEDFKSLGSIVLKPIYRKTLSTVDIINENPNFRNIYSIKDPRIQDILECKLKSTNQPLVKEILKFRSIGDKELLPTLNSLNSYLLNYFTSYDRALILYLALKETNIYKDFNRALESKDLKKIEYYLDILMSRENPLVGLDKILDITGINYYNLIREAMANKKEENVKKVNKL